MRESVTCIWGRDGDGGRFPDLHRRESDVPPSDNVPLPESERDGVPFRGRVEFRPIQQATGVVSLEMGR